MILQRMIMTIDAAYPALRVETSLQILLRLRPDG
jgi:hypothetical protein